MAKKEDLVKLRQVVESAVLARKKLLDDTQRKKHEDIIRITQEHESRLRATGVVNLFENIRDEGIVTDGANPAEVQVEGNRAWLLFNFSIFHGGSSRNCVLAFLENDSLIVMGNEKYVVGKGISIVDAVGKAIANPQLSKQLDN